MSVELSLSIFTAFMQVSVGLSLCLSYTQLTTEAGSDEFQKEWLLVFSLVAVGLMASILHLGKPAMAAFGMKNVALSWLSREGVSVFAFLILSFLSYYTKTSAVLTLATIASAVVCLVSQGFTYAATGLPSIDNIYPLVWFSLTALGGGGAAFVALGHDDSDSVIPSLVPFFVLALMVSLIALPFTWLNSSHIIVQKTAANWYGSIIFWAGIVCLAACVVLSFIKKLPRITFVLCLAGIFLTRMVFFIGTVHSKANIGEVY